MFILVKWCINKNLLLSLFWKLFFLNIFHLKWINKNYILHAIICNNSRKLIEVIDVSSLSCSINIGHIALIIVFLCWSYGKAVHFLKVIHIYIHSIDSRFCKNVKLLVYPSKKVSPFSTRTWIELLNNTFE